MLTAGRGPRRVGAGLVMALVGLLVLPAPAQAAGWQSVTSLHGARVQVCAVPAGTAIRVRVRVDSRRSTHPHVGALQTADGRRSRLVRAAPGRLSPVRSLVVGRRAKVVAGIGEVGGSGAVAGARRASRISRC